MDEIRPNVTNKKGKEEVKVKSRKATDCLCAESHFSFNYIRLNCV